MSLSIGKQESLICLLGLFVEFISQDKSYFKSTINQYFNDITKLIDFSKILDGMNFILVKLLSDRSFNNNSSNTISLGILEKTLELLYKNNYNFSNERVLYGANFRLSYRLKYSTVNDDEHFVYKYLLYVDNIKNNKKLISELLNSHLISKPSILIIKWMRTITTMRINIKKRFNTNLRKFQQN